ncbi:MAG: hypothetical protein LC102_02085 [Ignavibacteriales bacterium]|nr:MAG: hypothetical protein F9K26_04175 [Ignavibacteriaceae bacterium]MBW7873512.1 hypothetical protein [Ignavibacteria bacterium]MCZ2142203.1 hypothetical protein [Ignavibacteriales bacterium]MBV6444938.1 hypothetical protein [Ignavibacteriaceae bacterium]MBZ0196696.1 hypothetical protein [Ignavibacteriaceae bacterium]
MALHTLLYLYNQFLLFRGKIISRSASGRFANWKPAFQLPGFKWFFAGTFILSFILAKVAGLILVLNESKVEKTGFNFPDPILSLFSPIDFTWPIFICLYGALFLTLYYLSFRPIRLMMGFQAYFFLLSARLVCMFFLPLKAPDTLIPLLDPFITLFSQDIVLKHDLFFSGHFSVVVLFSLAVEDKIKKYFIVFLAVIMAVFILLQHVHYTIDLLVAPFFSYAIWRATVAVNKKLGYVPEV